MIFKDKAILITGGTGSLGKNLVRRIMTGAQGIPKKVIIFSRDEDKQYQMKLEWKNMKAATDDIYYHNYEELLDFRIGEDALAVGLKMHLAVARRMLGREGGAE